MQLEFLVRKNNKIFNTFNGQEVNEENAKNVVMRLERKNNIMFFPRIINDNLLYKYKTIVSEKEVTLIVYEGTFADEITWIEKYNANIIFNKPGITESSDEFDFWHEYFATNYGNSSYEESNVELFDMNDSMKQIRKLFTTHLEANIFLFFEKYKNAKKIKEKTFDIEVFKNISLPKINKTVGKYLDSKGEDVYYAIQHEIELLGEVFFDVNLIVGPVKNGIMDIKEHHRYFITNGFCYSPTNSDLALLVNNKINGKIYKTLMQKKYPDLMLNKYNSTYFYQYLLSKHFIPAFEILAKAEFTNLADLCMEEYLDREDKYTEKVNYFGKNDKEILGFKIAKLRNISEECYHSLFREKFSGFAGDVNYILKNFPSAFNTYCDKYIFEYLRYRSARKTISKEVEYLKKIGTSNAPLYSDYIRLCEAANRYSGGLFPTNLKFHHDLMVSYTNELKEANKNIYFENRVKGEEYLSLLYDDDKEYCILAPRKANDLVNESYKLSHCVRGYISDVAKGYTKIYFLRNKEKKSTPLVTIEVKRNTITQARGKANRVLSAEENAFVDKWSTIKGLRKDYYF